MNKVGQILFLFHTKLNLRSHNEVCFLSYKPFSWWVWGDTRPQRPPWDKMVTRSSAAHPPPGRRCGHSALQPRPSGVSTEWLFWLENTEENNQEWKVKLQSPGCTELAQVNPVIYEEESHVLWANWKTDQRSFQNEKFRQGVPKYFSYKLAANTHWLCCKAKCPYSVVGATPPNPLVCSLGFTSILSLSFCLSLPPSLPPSLPSLWKSSNFKDFLNIPLWLIHSTLIAPLLHILFALI